MEYQEIIKNYDFPHCDKHKTQKIERICLNQKCPNNFEILCQQCLENCSEDFHNHSIKFLPKLKQILLQLCKQIFENPQGGENDFDSQNLEIQNQKFNFNNNENESQALLRLQSINQQMSESQNNDNLGLKIVEIGEKLVILGQELSKMVLNYDKNAIKKWQKSNFKKVSDMVIEILENEGNIQILTNNFKTLQFHCYIQNEPLINEVQPYQNNKNDSIKSQQNLPYLRIKKFNLYFDVDDFQQELQQLQEQKMFLQERILTQVFEYLQNDDNQQQNDENKINERENIDQKPTYLQKSQQKQYIQQQFLKKRNLTVEEFNEAKQQLWKKCLNIVYNKCLRYPGFGDQSCLVMYNQPGYCKNCSIILDVYNETINQIKMKVKE
ncbi:hypothetical protein PPERSA_06212 [Pseudocohnilembus persalinus]|uniref:Uncharacterized protein n=1 Tax=Pseudocohnilembus persalinus TaxID=266149 RepID=A0A0V0R0H8_PSEPJ|nr:hypothetical protein PPERSA_06212 [Pseudocohnilembus persalinus]|eukprot:KRX08034.1 hypothetical protein PPERSA_06212 [Pseudocohnilembus persalinus]